ncbi:hypothetical protein [Bifidobacterium choloepi]|uniref:Uncharacterized protein n=1 Tax=Bifidobacterium choloepi TaxID=2614131 RepID=A0A6I5N9C2_9BIFI|nr:hypothetical protein [Bifidobacterium choloepi]NEG70401.1 hypothetical protein [Bifidobacterium choloepi]
MANSSNGRGSRKNGDGRRTNDARGTARKPAARPSGNASGRGAGKMSGKSAARTAGRNAGKPAGAGGRAPGKVRPKKMSKEKRAMYRRRRAVVGIGVVVVLVVAVLCIYSLIRGAFAMHEIASSASAYSISRESSAPSPSATSNVPDCSSSDVQLKLSADKTTVAVGGTVTFTAEIDFTGKETGGCFVDGADDSRVLVIKSGNDTIYRSDACQATYRPLLMFKDQVDSQTMTWNTNSTGDTCVDDSTLPHVSAGTYQAQLTLVDSPDVTSNTVTISVE